MMVNEVRHIREQLPHEKNVARLRSWVDKLLGHVDDQAREISRLNRLQPPMTTGIVNDQKGRVESSE